MVNFSWPPQHRPSSCVDTSLQESRPHPIAITSGVHFSKQTHCTATVLFNTHTSTLIPAGNSQQCQPLLTYKCYGPIIIHLLGHVTDRETQGSEHSCPYWPSPDLGNVEHPHSPISHHWAQDPTRQESPLCVQNGLASTGTTKLGVI